MAYDGKILHAAVRQFEEDRDRYQKEFLDRQESIYVRQPRLREIDEELKSTAARIILSALRRGTDPVPVIERLRDENLNIQTEKRQLLERMGLPADALDEVPRCALCGDTGYRGGTVCRCLRQYYAREQKKELSRLLDLGNQSFDSFDSSWYSDLRMPGMKKTAREQMELVYDICVEFAHNFGKTPANLLFFGRPGLGKTHLSAAIAREVSESGHSVVYDTAGHVFSRFEAQKFGRDDAEDDVRRVLECDLLILDDLGTEMTTAFVQSALYQIINTRLMEQRSTIISTNLMPEKLSERYSEQIASRIEGEYRYLPFVGEDIRKLKKEQNR